jgi:hypothetical protein
MPPSEITGSFTLSQNSITSKSAENCGTPTPAITRVVHIEPGPMPTLTPSTPASKSAFFVSGLAKTLTISLGVVLGFKRSREGWRSGSALPLLATASLGLPVFRFDIVQLRLKKNDLLFCSVSPVSR